MKKVKISNLCEWIVALCVFTNGLGVVVYIAGINVVNYLTILAFIFIAADLLRNNKTLNYFAEGNKWFLIIFFIFWIFYAFTQTVFIDLNKEFFNLGFHQLIANAMFVFFVCYVIHDARSFAIIRNAMVGVLIVNTMIGVFEVITGIHFSETESIWTANSTRAFQSNPNEYATTLYCAMMGVMLLSLQKKLELKLKILLVCSIICIITSHSRGILGAVIIFCLAYCLMEIYYYFKGNINFIKLLLIIGLGLGGYIVVSGMFMDILNWLVGNFSGKGNFTSDMYRIQLIKGGMELFLESCGVGIGAGQSIYLLKMNLHNFLLEMLVEYGIVVFLGVLFILWYIWRISFEKCIPRKNRCIYFALIPSVIMASITSSSINKFKLFWVMLIMFYMSKYYLADNRDKTSRERNVYEIS